jgi:hypothetical protein
LGQRVIEEVTPGVHAILGQCHVQYDQKFGLVTNEICDPDPEVLQV